MGRLVNELSWSRTRMATLANCKRQYYYQYYQKWGGWEWDADEASKKAYLFTKMTNLAMLVGHEVHETVKIILEDIRDFGRIRLEDPELHVRKDRLSKTWREAEQGLWKRSLKQHPPMFEHYYDAVPPPERLKELGAKASRCIRNFLDGALFAELKADDASRWLAVDPGPSFDDSTKLKLDGRTIWALPDFARKNPADECEIWDWKTGQSSPHDYRQLLSYALFARDRWGFPGDKIRLFAYYLPEDKVVEHPCDEARLEESEDLIRADFETMIALLSNEKKNEPLPPDEHFPMLEDPGNCRPCFFRELCGR